MKFYSHSNTNGDYSKAVSLENIRSIRWVEGDGRSALRFSVCLTYTDNANESFSYLEENESQTIYKEIVEILNKS